MGEPEHFEVLIIGSGQGGKHMAGRTTAPPSSSVGGSAAHTPTSLRATWFDHNN